MSTLEPFDYFNVLFQKYIHSILFYLILQNMEGTYSNENGTQVCEIVLGFW